MANNLRYLLEHFCLDGQKIDISSQLDEENANNIEKINTQTVPSINARIDDIKNTDIPNINSRIDSIKNTDIPNINQKINTINNTTIPSVQESVNAVDEKADRINESVSKNTRDIGTLSDNVTMQGNAINSINTEKIPSIENNISELTAKVGANTNSINDLTTKVGTNTDNIGELTTKVDTNTNSINELNTKVNTNTDSINTINNTSIPHLQSEIDNLSGGGTGSVGELREKVEKNTADISELNGKVETNTTAISTINNTSIPHLQSEVDSIKSSLNSNWKEILLDYKTPKGFIVSIFDNEKIGIVQVNARLDLPKTVTGGNTITEIIPNLGKYAPHHESAFSAVFTDLEYTPEYHGVFSSFSGNELKLGFTMPTFDFTARINGSLLYYY